MHHINDFYPIKSDLSDTWRQKSAPLSGIALGVEMLETDFNEHSAGCMHQCDVPEAIVGHIGGDLLTDHDLAALSHAGGHSQ